jgi:hypothetical protein
MQNRQSHLIGFLDKKKTTLGLVVGSLVFATHALAQVTGFGRSSAPIYGGTGIAAQPASPFQPMQGTFAAAHKTSDGKPCISVSASARAQAVNPKIIDQVVLVNNFCGQPIKVQVCYPKSSDCITVVLEGFQKLQRILGIGSSPAFAYEYRELF